MVNSSSIQIEQNKEGYRHSMEPFLLGGFVDLKPGLRLLDIGTGSGIIPLLLSARESDFHCTALEIQPSLYEVGKRNVELNGLEDKIEILCADFLKSAPMMEQESFDLIVSNPPYRKLNSGKINPHRGKAVARHELTLSLPALVKNSFPLLKSGGVIALAYPMHRFDEVERALLDCGFSIKRIRHVHGSREVQAKFFLVEAVKGKVVNLKEDSFFIYNLDGSYTREMQDIYASFNYSGRSHRLRKN